MEILGIEIDERVALAAGAGLMACLILGTKPGQTMAMKIGYSASSIETV